MKVAFHVRLAAIAAFTVYESWSAPAFAQPTTTDATWHACVNAQAEGAADACSTLLASGKLSPSDRAIALEDRATAYNVAGRFARAIQDFDASLALTPAGVDALNGRCVAFSGIGEYARAIADCTKALDLKPDYAFAAVNRGYAHFFAGSFGDAATDFARAVAGEPTNPYAMLWLHIARRRDGEDDTAEFARNLKTVDLRNWPAPIVNFYAGKTDVDHVTDFAESGSDHDQDIKVCEADFYLGESAIFSGERAFATPFLAKAEHECGHASNEYTAARLELQRLP